MARTMEIPSRQEARTKEVTIPVSATVNGAKVESNFQTELPVSMADAIGLFGEKDVFRRFLNAHVVHLQSTERRKLTATDDSKPSRKRASYLEELEV